MEFGSRIDACSAWFLDSEQQFHEIFSQLEEKSDQVKDLRAQHVRAAQRISVCGQLVFRIGAGGACRRPADRHGRQRMHELQGQSSPPAREERRSRDSPGGTACAAAEVQRELGASARADVYARPGDIFASEANEYAKPGAGPASAICTQDDDATNGPRGAKAKAGADVDPPARCQGGADRLQSQWHRQQQRGHRESGPPEPMLVPLGQRTLDCRDRNSFSPVIAGCGKGGRQ